MDYLDGFCCFNFNTMEFVFSAFICQKACLGRSGYPNYWSGFENGFLIFYANFYINNLVDHRVTNFNCDVGNPEEVSKIAKRTINEVKKADINFTQCFLIFETKGWLPNNFD
ncbi:hypothetical protein HK096_005839 [Nowakowskiella sp. JEL0078]|nr:hypothetical protein HK096_005839 [Nowakowskiella sp. JEL0078]